MTLKDIGNSLQNTFSGAAKSVGNFLQQYPTPMSFLQSQSPPVNALVQNTQKVAQNIGSGVQAVKNNQYFPQAVRQAVQGGIPWTNPLNPYKGFTEQLLPTALQTGVNALLQPITKNPMTFNFIPESTLQSYSHSGPFGGYTPAVTGGLQTLNAFTGALSGPVTAANPIGVGKSMLGLNAATQGVGAVAKGIREKQSLPQIGQNTARAIVGQGDVSGILGGIFGENPLTMAGDVAIGFGLPMLLHGKNNEITTYSKEVRNQLRDAGGRYAAGDTPVKPPKMPQSQWKFQLQFNEKYGRNPYEPVMPSDLTKAIKIEAEKRVGFQARPVGSDTIPGNTPMLPPGQTQLPSGEPMTPGYQMSRQEILRQGNANTDPAWAWEKQNPEAAYALFKQREARQNPNLGEMSPYGPPVPKPPVTQSAIPEAVQSPTTAEIPQVDPIAKLTQALKEAVPIRGQQEALYTKARGARIGAVANIQGQLGGEAGFQQELGQLKGELPKVAYESIRKNFTQPEVDALFNTVKQNTFLTPFEKVTAQNALTKMLGVEGGTVPTEGEIKLLNEVFPQELTAQLLAKRPLIQKVIAEAGDALNIPRALMATFDMSAPLRQGAFLITRPKEWLPAFGNMFKYALSEKAYKGAMETMKADPVYPVMREAGLSLTDIGGILSNREETFMSNIVDKIPGIGIVTKASGRAYSGFLNKLRFDTFKNILQGATENGLTVDEVAPTLAKFVNAATGRGDLTIGPFDLNRYAPALNSIFFSPRLLASRINLLNPQFYASLNPYVRKEALKSLVTTAGLAVSVLSLAKMAGAQVGTDPRSADFGKIRVGNTRYDILAGFQQPIRLMAQLISGKIISTTTGKEMTLGEGYKPMTRKDVIMNFFQSKESPVIGFATGLLEGSNAIGQKFNVPAEIAQRFIPMIMQDMYDLAQEKGSYAQGILGTLPGVFGVGVQTYGTQVPSIKVSPTTGKASVQFQPTPGLSENLISKLTGQPVIPNQLKDPTLFKAYQDKQQQTILKEKLKRQMEAGNMQPEGTFIPIVVKGVTKVIDTSFQPTPPQLTGLTELDKKAVSAFNSEISQKATDIYDLYQAGKITQDDANTQLSQLKDLKTSYAPGKAPKKVSVPSMSVKKLPTVQLKQPKFKAIKTKAPPKLKTSGLTRKTKTISVAPIKTVKLRGLTGGKKLV